MALHSFCGGCYAITRKLQQYGRPYCSSMEGHTAAVWKAILQQYGRPHYPKHSPSLSCNFCLQIGLIERVDTIYKGTDFGKGFESGMGFEIKEVNISTYCMVRMLVGG